MLALMPEGPELKLALPSGRCGGEVDRDFLCPSLVSATPAENAFGRATTSTATSTLYANLAACVFGETRHPERQVCIDDIIDDGTRNVVVEIIEGPEPVVNIK